MARPNRSQVDEKYSSRSYYTGKLVKMERTETKNNLIIQLLCRVATPYYDKNVKVRIYVPQQVECYLNNTLEIGRMYHVICAPYYSMFKGYRHRVDMLLDLYYK